MDSNNVFIKNPMFNHKLPTDFPMQTLRKKTSPCKYKNEPGRFLGEGVSFRAKLIGVLEVPEARGDRMCQEALADLKMAIRAAGEHKQRIQVHVAIDGLRLRDDKTGDSLYHHPVHKISFIAQDMTDSRAFGYIFGSPDTGHRFFGIKTDKAASQVVIAMRDLFQVVFELKKKEVEMAKQQLEGKTVVTGSLTKHLTSLISDTNVKSITNETTTPMAKTAEVGTESGVAELVDLEQELSSLRRGLTQVEGLTPSSDPFGDSFIVPSQKGLLPPPPSLGNARGRTAVSARTTFSPTNTTPDSLPFDLAPLPADLAPAPASMVDNITEPPVSQPAASTTQMLNYDVFTELDPLGTGRSKPYVDKKLFFQELKNPPKKVLKDLVPTTQSLLNDILPVTKESKSDYGPATTMTSLTRHSGGSVTIAKQQNAMFTGNYFTNDPFAETDPFDNTDPFSDSFKDDPFTSMQDFPKSSALRLEDTKSKPKETIQDKPEPPSLEAMKNVFNGPLQVTLPPEPAPKSPRLQRQSTDTSTIRQRPQPSSKLNPENTSPPPPLPPKKTSEVIAVRPPPRPPHEHEHEDSEQGPPLPRPARKREPLADRSTKPRLSSGATNSSEEEYLTPAPPPLPAAKRFDITLAQLLTCTMDELANRLHVPAATLSSMTLPQLTDYLRSYLAADTDRAHIHIEPTVSKEKEKPLSPIIPPATEKPALKIPSLSAEFKPQFEDNFAPGVDSNGTFVANFEDFDRKANPTYDRYAAFREIQEQELKAKSILDPKDDETEPRHDDSDNKEELTAINMINRDRDGEVKELARSPLKTLDELTLDSFNMFRNSVSPKPMQIDAKIEDIKTVMKNLQIDKARRSVSPRDNGKVDVKHEDSNDRYAALREITITEPSQDEFESIPPDVPKERKKSDEKSDGFDNSDFFDCIDNSSLSFTHVEDAFRKSPSVKERDDDKRVESVKEIAVELMPVRDLQPPERLSTGSISDVISGSSPDTKEKVSGGAGSGVGAPSGVVSRWGSVRPSAGSACSSDSRDSEPRPRRRTRHSPATRIVRPPIVQTSSSSRDVSPWDEDLSPVTRLQRPLSHHRDRESRHNSSGSREYLDSGSGREKEKMRDKRDIRDRDLSRDSRESARDRRDSGSGRDRHDLSKDRDHRESRDRRDRRSRDRENDSWDRDRNYSRERDYRDSRSRERPTKDYREKDRERHRRQRHSYDEDEEDYSDGCGSGRSSPRERWPDQRWRREEKNYGSLGWRETRRRAEMRQTEDSEKRYGSTLGWPARRNANARRESERERELIRELPRDTRDPRDMRRRTKRDETRPRPRDYRFSNDFSPREREHTSPFDDFQESPAIATKKRTPYSSLEGTRFAFEPEDATASPLSGSSARARDGDSPATRFRFDSDSISPRSMFEDDFTTLSTPRCRTASIAEEDEDVPPLRVKPTQQSHRDIKKSESINIFTRDSDPFEGDAFFACTGSDRVARRENWPGDFQGFDNA